MVLVVVKLADPIADMNGPFDASGHDCVANFVAQNLLAQVGHNRTIEDWPIADAWTINAQSRSVAKPGRPSIADPGSRRQLSRGRAIRSAQEVIQAISIHGLTGTNDARQLGRINGRQSTDRWEISGDGPIAQDRTVAAWEDACGRTVSYRAVTQDGARWKGTRSNCRSTTQNGP